MLKWHSILQARAVLSTRAGGRVFNSFPHLEKKMPDIMPCTGHRDLSMMVDDVDFHVKSKGEELGSEKSGSLLPIWDHRSLTSLTDLAPVQTTAS
jgi:hypothetical protein